MSLGAKHFAGWVFAAKLSRGKAGNLTLDNIYKTETCPGMDSGGEKWLFCHHAVVFVERVSA